MALCARAPKLLDIIKAVVKDTENQYWWYNAAQRLIAELEADND